MYLVGVPLLERTGRGVRLTDEGRVLVRHAEAIFAELEKAETALEATRVSVAGRLRVAAFSSVTAALLAPTVARLAVRHPQVEVTVVESDPTAGLRDLRLAELDIVVAHEYDHLLIPPDPDIDRRELFTEPMWVAAPVGRFAPGHAVGLRDLAGDVWAAAPPSSDCGTAVRAACRAAGFEPDIRYHFAEFGVVLHLVAAGLAVSVLPRLAFTEPCEGYEVHPLVSGAFNRRVFIASRRANRHRPAVLVFVDALEAASAVYRSSSSPTVGPPTGPAQPGPLGPVRARRRPARCRGVTGTGRLGTSHGAGPGGQTRMVPGMEVRQVRLSDPLIAPLLSGLADEYEARYGASDEMALTHVAEFDPPTGLFVALVDEGAVVAGGGFRELSAGVCDVKRMWTRADRRRQGLASTVLQALEDAARSAGYRALRLETGPAQPEAAALYASRRYHRIPAYGRYPVALAFELDLARQA